MVRAALAVLGAGAEHLAWAGLLPEKGRFGGASVIFIFSIFLQGSFCNNTVINSSARRICSVKLFLPTLLLL